MRNTLIILACLLIIPIISYGQKKVKEKDIIGTWQLIIPLNEMDDDDEDEDYENREVDESFLGHVISSGVKALVANILDEIEIEFEVRKDGTIEITAMGERDDDDDNVWLINSEGELVIKERGERISDNDDVWLLKDGKLQAYEKRGSRLKEKDVYLKRVDK